MFYAVKDGDEIKSIYASTPPKDSLGVIPGDIDVDDFENLKASKDVDEHGEPYWKIEIDSDKKKAKEQKKKKEERHKKAKDKKEKDIHDKIASIYPDSDESNLVVKAEVWRAMASNADRFKDLGLKTVEQVNASDNTELFSPGSALDTVKKIKDYAERKLELYGDFLVEKAKAEQAYEDEKDGNNS